ncbi:chaperone modulator CbpM [Fastidiosibacter lacustris]|uniref:chaperone modulator CbpM n=1 Tax=Fastidiosibacter lacustris TaxID=2056695 RepID=UPI000E342D4E|nr:chaperone modulator CbpM [Fastidiosibacter lacustris]
MSEIISESQYITVVELSKLLCVPQAIIVEWIEHEVIYAEHKQDIYYIAASDIVRAKSAMRLAYDLGVNASGISIILQLREKIQQLEALLNK